MKNIKTFKMLNEENEKTPSFSELAAMAREKVYAQKYLTCPDADTILFAKEIAKKYKVRYQDILAQLRPTGSVITRVWDSNGNIVPYKKIFY